MKSLFNDAAVGIVGRGLGVEMRVSLGRNSPSFVIAILLVITLLGLYVWRAARPHPRGASDVIVRDFVEMAQKDVRAGRRAIDRAAARVRAGGALEEVVKSIDEAASETIRSIESKAQAAIDRLEQIEDITIKTEQNRRARIRARLDEMKQAIGEAQSDATDGVRSHTEAVPAQ